jgi:hypothetical protein
MSKAKKDGTAAKSTKGIPRVTDKVLAGGDALKKYQDAVAKLPASVQKECNDRLAKAQAEGRKPKTVNFSTIFTGRSVEDLMVAKTALDAAMVAAAAAEEAEAEAQLARITAKVAAMKAAKSGAPATAPATV